MWVGTSEEISYSVTELRRVKGTEGATGSDTCTGSEESKEGGQYRLNFFVHLIFKDLVLFVTAL